MKKVKKHIKSYNHFFYNSLNKTIPLISFQPYGQACLPARQVQHDAVLHHV